MRKEILEALTAKFEGVSASILGRIADKLAKTATTPEQVKTAVEGMTLQQVIESYGDSRATEASNTARENAVKDYESRYGLKDGAKTAANNAGGAATTATGENGNGGESEPPAWAKAMMERLDRMEMTMASPPGPDLTGMPRGSGTPSDRTGMMVERKMELEEQIDRLKAEEKQERNAIEGLILQLSDPDERAVIRLRYFDRADWESTCGVLFGDRRDYVDRVDAYQNRTYKIHGRALLNLAAVLDELEPLPELRQ